MPGDGSARSDQSAAEFVSERTVVRTSEWPERRTGAGGENAPIFPPHDTASTTTPVGSISRTMPLSPKFPAPGTAMTGTFDGIFQNARVVVDREKRRICPESSDTAGSVVVPLPQVICQPVKFTLADAPL